MPINIHEHFRRWNNPIYLLKKCYKKKRKKENKRNVTIILKNITQVYWKFKLSGAGLSFVQILVLCIGLPYASCNREEES
jgi:hypothetical protein